MIYFENINSDIKSYNFLVDFYNQNKGKSLDNLEISFQNVEWIAANTCSMIGAIFQKLHGALNTIKLVDINETVKDILERNGFLSFIGYPRIPDLKNTSIQFLKLSPKDSRYFIEYIHDDLFGKEAMPSMSPSFRKKIAQGIFEIFINSGMHSETKEGIFTCGQFFPRKHSIEFMITDLGIGIKNRIRHYLNKPVTAIEAIEWAIQERNTTKTLDSGGLGLSMLMSFIRLNKGKIQIISNDGFWESSDEGTFKAQFNSAFPGTAVNIEINTDTSTHYILPDEKTIRDEDVL